MGITRNCFPKKRRRCQFQRARRYKSRYYGYKKYNKNKFTKQSYISHQLQIEIKDMFENELYELVSQMAHVRMYVKNMRFEYCGETAEEMEIYWLMIDDLHYRALKHYHAAVKDEKDLRFDHLEGYKKEYNDFMDEVGITYDNVYEFLFDFPDDGGYQTPPKKIAQIKHTYDELEEITMRVSNM